MFPAKHAFAPERVDAPHRVIHRRVVHAPREFRRVSAHRRCERVTEQRGEYGRADVVAPQHRGRQSGGDARDIFSEKRRPLVETPRREIEGVRHDRRRERVRRALFVDERAQRFEMLFEVGYPEPRERAPVAAARVAAVREHGVVRLARPHADELEASQETAVASRLGRLEPGVGQEHDARARGGREPALARERQHGQDVALAAVRGRDHHHVGSSGRHQGERGGECASSAALFA